MRVGEAKNPGTEGITVDSISPTQWDSGAQFSTPDRGSGLTGSASESSLLDAMEFDLTTADDAVTGEAVGEAEQILRQLAARVGPSLTMPSCLAVSVNNGGRLRTSSFCGQQQEMKRQSPVLDWLTEATASMQRVVDSYERAVNPGEAVRSSWISLRSVMRTWGVDSREDLSQWSRSHGFAATQPGNHIPTRAPEAQFEEACRIDVRVELLEAVFVRQALYLGRHTVMPRGAEPATNQSAPASRTAVQ